MDGESAGDDYLASVSSKTYDGKSANGDITDVLDKTLKQVGIAGEIAPKDVPVPTLSLIHILLEEGACLKYNREFRSARGRYQGTEIGCVSTGIGTTSAEICIHELCNIGVETAIRIGTTGSISPRFAPGDLIIPVAAIRADGTSDCYIDRSFPAVANLDVVNALGEACEHLGFRYGYGIMYSLSLIHIWTTNQDLAVERFDHLCAVCGEYGLTVNLEFVAWGICDDLQKAKDLLKMVGRSNARITLDIMHLYYSSVTPEEIAACPPELFGDCLLYTSVLRTTCLRRI